MIIPSGTKVEVHTSNGGFVRGKTYGKTEVLQASDGLSVCGGITVFKVGSPNASGVSISAHRISRVAFS